MSTESQGLRTESQFLKQSRQSFIQTLADKQQFEKDFAVINPELNRLWAEKILPILGYTKDKIADFLETASLLVEMEVSAVTINIDATDVINWRHYLYNYTPQLLQKAITQTAHRLTHGTREMEPIRNVSAYFKSLVQDLRKKEKARLPQSDPNHQCDTLEEIRNCPVCSIP